MEKTRVVVRIWLNSKLFLKERIDVTTEEEEAVIPDLVTKHQKLLIENPHVIELEFIDELDPKERYFRFGTDPHGMVQPIRVIGDPTRN